ncbi:MAG: twin-arginine translocation signal domain-containing protein, partial [Planctomycetota bacterium]
MKKSNKGFTRRDFLKGAAGAAIIGAAGAKVSYGQDEKKPVKEEQAKEQKKQPAKGPSRVVLIRDEKVIDDNRKIDAERIESMLDEGVTELLGTKTPD